MKGYLLPIKVDTGQVGRFNSLDMPAGLRLTGISFFHHAILLRVPEQICDIMVSSDKEFEAVGSIVIFEGK